MMPGAPWSPHGRRCCATRHDVTGTASDNDPPTWKGTSPVTYVHAPAVWSRHWLTGSRTSRTDVASVAARGERAGVASAKRHLNLLGPLAPALRPHLVRARTLAEAFDPLATP